MSEALNYEDQLTKHELKKEVRRLWDAQHALDRALIGLPEVPPIEVLRLLVHGAMNTGKKKLPRDLWEIGKKIQEKHNSVTGSETPIPFRTEYECAAGLWHLIRAALIDESEQSHE